MESKPTRDKHTIGPPPLAVNALEFLLPKDVGHFLVGDLHEGYLERIDGADSQSTANRWFWKQAALALVFWFFRGNLQLLALAFNGLFYTGLAYLYIEMSGASHYPVALGSAWLVLPLSAAISATFLSNLSIVQDTIIYFSTNRKSLSNSRLTRIRDLAMLLKTYSLVIGLVCLAKSGLELLAIDNTDGEFVYASSSLGLAWLLFIHALAQSALFALFEENLQALLCKSNGQIPRYE